MIITLTSVGWGMVINGEDQFQPQISMRRLVNFDHVKYTAETTFGIGLVFTDQPTIMVVAETIDEIRRLLNET